MINWNNEEVRHITYTVGRVQEAPRVLYMNGSLVWTAAAGTYQRGSLPAGVSALACYRTSADPGVTASYLHTGGDTVRHLDKLSFTASYNSYWSGSITTPSVTIYYTDEVSENTYDGVKLSGVTATRKSRTLTASSINCGTLSYSATLIDGTEAIRTISSGNQTWTDIWQGSTIPYTYTLDTSYRHTYYPLTISGSVIAGSMAILLNGTNLIKDNTISKTWVREGDLSASTTISTVSWGSSESTSRYMNISSIVPHLPVFEDVPTRLTVDYTYSSASRTATVTLTDMTISGVAVKYGEAELSNYMGQTVATLTCLIEKTNVTYLLWELRRSLTGSISVSLKDVEVEAFNTENPNLSRSDYGSQLYYVIYNDSLDTQYVEFDSSGVLKTLFNKYNVTELTNYKCLTVLTTSTIAVSDKLFNSSSAATPIDYDSTDMKYRLWHPDFARPTEWAWVVEG